MKWTNLEANHICPTSLDITIEEDLRMDIVPCCQGSSCLYVKLLSWWQTRCSFIPQYVLRVRDSFSREEVFELSSLKKIFIIQKCDCSRTENPSVCHLNRTSCPKMTEQCGIVGHFSDWLFLPLPPVTVRSTCPSARWACPCLWTASTWARGPPARWGACPPRASRCWANWWRPEDPTADLRRYCFPAASVRFSCDERIKFPHPVFVSVLQFGLQSFEIICNTTWASEDTCCDLPGVVSLSTLTFTEVSSILLQTVDAVISPSAE